MGSYSFDGVDDKVQYADAAALDALNITEYLLLVWIRPGASGNNNGRICNRGANSAGSSDHMQLAVGNMGNGSRNGNASARQKHATTGAIAYTDNAAVPNTTWTLLGAHFDPGPDEFRIFVNATEDTNLWTAGSGAFDNESDQAFAFGNGVGGSRAYHGHIAYWGCWDVSGLTNGQIDTLVSDFYNSGTGTVDVPNQTELVEFVRFSASGETSGDLSVLTSPTVTGAAYDSGQSPPVTYNALGGGATEHERSATIAATGAVTVANREFFSVFERSTAAAATGAVTIAAYRRDHHRQTAASATGAVAVTAFQRDHQRNATLTGTGTITVAGAHDHHRQVAVSATGTIASTPQRDLLRQVTLDAASLIATRGEIEGVTAEHERAASLAATGAITADGHGVLHRSSSLTATGTVTVTTTTRDHHRQITVAAAGAIQVGHQRELHRAISLTAAAAIDARPFTGRPWTYDNTDSATYDGTPDFTYDGEPDWTYTPVS